MKKIIKKNKNKIITLHLRSNVSSFFDKTFHSVTSFCMEIEPFATSPFPKL